MPEAKPDCRPTPDLCMHKAAHWMPGPLEMWTYGCPSCGLRGSGFTLEAAKTLFGIRAEKIKVKALLEKPLSKRTEKDWTWIAYSPFGTGSWCGY